MEIPLVSILKNAIDSIAIGLEDYQSPDERRILSSTRNIFAGILLLFKYKLSNLSPANSDEALIKQKILPKFDDSGDVNWVGQGNKTVDVQNIKERFQSLDITVDWKRIDSINKYRNDIEHYYSTLNTESIQKLISDSFLIIRDFIVNHLEMDPKELLGETPWKVLVDINEVYEKEKQACNTSLNSLDYIDSEILNAISSYKCSECGSDLIECIEDNSKATDSLFKCKSCNKQYDYTSLVQLAIEDYYEGDIYLAHKDGGDIPITTCPFCGNSTYLYHEGICAVCGDSATHECERCGCNIPPEEISDENICGYCSYMWEEHDGRIAIF